MLFGRHDISGSILKLFILYKLFQSKKFFFFEIILTNKKKNKAKKTILCQSMSNFLAQLRLKKLNKYFNEINILVNISKNTL